MAEQRPHPLNASGPFYVTDGCCLTCDLPRTLAPDMFKYTADGSHCYVYKQPETADQLRRMFEAMASAEVACIRFRGGDRRLMKRLNQEGLAGLCDSVKKGG